MRLRKFARTSVAALLAVTALLTLTAAASADVSKAQWAGVGQVVYVGPSLDPGAPTSVTAEFNINRRTREVKSVVITTSNEFVTGVLAGGRGGAVTECKDRDRGATCADLNKLLTGSVISSLHTSTARLTDIKQSAIPLTIQTPGGPVTVNIPVLSGDLRGRIQGVFIISKDGGQAVGSTSLAIKKGSTGTYACFGITPQGPTPLPSLDSCIDQTGGQFFPIVLNVLDKGKFQVGEGSGALSEVLGLKGRVEVTAQTNLLLGQFGGKITIPKAKAQLGEGKLDAAFWADPELDAEEPE